MVNHPKLTPEEEELVRQGEEAFRRAEKLPPPPRRLQERMQDQVPRENETSKDEPKKPLK
jgi:hypothetical protein